MTLFDKRSIRIITNTAICVSLISCIIAIIMYTTYSGQFKAIWIWPFAFLFFVILNYSSMSHVNNNHFLVMTLIIVLELIPRYVLYPLCVLSINDNNYIGVLHYRLSANELFKGTMIGFFELIIFSVFVFIFERIRPPKDFSSKEKMGLLGNKNVYLVYILFSIIIYLLIGKALNVVQFLFVSSGYDDIVSNIYYTLVKYIVSIGLSISLLMIINREKKKYNIFSNNLYIYVAVICSIIYVGFIVGESRSTQIAIGLIIMLILIEEFPSKKRLIVFSLIAAIIVIVISLSVFRTGSSETILGSSLEGFANKLQIYYGGPGSIYQSIDLFERNNSVTISNFFFDFIRSCFPFNLFFKNSGFTTSQIYNLTLYSGMYSHGHIIFGSSFGYIYFSFPGIPIIICLNYFLASKANEIYYRTRSYEIKYLSGYCMIRLVNAFLSNTPTILGSITQYIGTFGLLILLSQSLKKEKQRN